MNAAQRQVWKLGEPSLDVVLGIVRLEVGLVGVALVEDDAAWRRPVLLQEVDEVGVDAWAGAEWSFLPSLKLLGQVPVVVRPSGEVLAGSAAMLLHLYNPVGSKGD